MGHVFYLGTKYSKAMDCSFLNEDGKSMPAVMGCYGIGVTRIMSAAIEQNHDERGICWPVPLAPFEAVVLPLNMKDETVVGAAEAFYVKLVEAGVEALLDDRPARAGVKFNDADLVGFPYQVVFGPRDLAEGLVEVKFRPTGEKLKLSLEEALDFVVSQVRQAKQGHVG